MITKEKLKRALKTSTRWKKDECEDFNLFGKFGKVFYDNNNWYVYISNRKLALVKRKINFMQISQEGDFELIYKAQELPNSRQATIIRQILGLKAKRVLSAEHLLKLSRSNEKHRFKSASNHQDLSQG